MDVAMDIQAYLHPRVNQLSSTSQQRLVFKQKLGGGFKYLNIFYFHPYFGKIPMLTNIFKWVGTTN